MPPRKNPQKTEQREFRIIDPENVKQSVEIPVKPRPEPEDLETIEKRGTKKRAVKRTIKKARKHTLDPNGPIVIITEKPQAAGKIAAALSNGKDRKITKNQVSYYELEREGKKIVVACAVGHLFTIAQHKKSSGYPVFDIGWYPNFEVKKQDFTRKYYSVIQKLVQHASEIVVATDFDIEGEVIGYTIVKYIAEQPDAKRMKFSALTAEEIQEAYDTRQQTLEWGQAIAGETRHFLDWLYGINLSRALMHAVRATGKFKIMSIGRVQGPTLHLIVNKEKEIQKFKPTPYWQVFITVNDGKNTLELKHNKDVTKKEELGKFEKLKGKTTDITTKKTTQTLPPPPPFDLTALQTETYKHHSITPNQTLQIAQKLYLAGLISYPRTASQKIPEAMQPRAIVKKLEKNFPQTKHVTRNKPLEGKKSDPAHPAIIPTGQFQKLEQQEKKIFELIVKRFISCFADDAEIENKKVETEIDNLKFGAKGLKVKKHGWMQVYPAKMQETDIKDMGGPATIEKVKTEEKETKPPKRYSPASIISELEKRNLGTKATRANILETLYDRNYIKDKQIRATELGIKLIDTLSKHSPIIINEKLTREIEKDMENIRESKKDLQEKEEAILKKAQNSLENIAQDFKTKELVIGKELVAANEALWEQQKEDNKFERICPSCTKGNLSIKFTPRFKSYFIACTNYPECKQTYSLPSRSLIKKVEKNCDACNWPMVVAIRKAKRPWILCFNPACPTKKAKEIDIDGNEKERETRYTG